MDWDQLLTDDASSFLIYDPNSFSSGRLFVVTYRAIGRPIYRENEVISRQLL